MAGLRELKKENRKKRIFEAALRLFKENGFEKTTMDTIAADAGLAVGTLYNYFPSKVELLFSIIDSGTDKYTQDLDRVIAENTSLRDSILDFYMIYLQSFATYGKRVWRELLGEFLFKQSNCMKMIDVIDKQFHDKIKELLTAFEKKGVLKRGADLEAAASALYALLGYNVIRYLSDPEMTEVELVGALRSQAELIVDAL